MNADGTFDAVEEGREGAYDGDLAAYDAGGAATSSGQVVLLRRAPVPPVEWTPPADNPWGLPLSAELHRRLWECPDLAGEPAWLAAFALGVPCGDCRSRRLPLVAAHPPDLSSREGCYAWTVARHDEVNRIMGTLVKTEPRGGFRAGHCADPKGFLWTVQKKSASFGRTHRRREVCFTQHPA